MTICSRTKGHCFQEQKAIVFKNKRLFFHIVFLLFCNLKILKQGIKMQFFPKRVVETLQKWAPPSQVTFKCPPSPPPRNDGLTREFYIQFSNIIENVFIQSVKHSHKVGELSSSQKQGVITLIEKTKTGHPYLYLT